MFQIDLMYTDIAGGGGGGYVWCAQSYSLVGPPPTFIKTTLCVVMFPLKKLWRFSGESPDINAINDYLPGL